MKPAYPTEQLAKFEAAFEKYLDAYMTGRDKEWGGELKLVNVKDNYVKHVFRTIELHRFISIEEFDGV